MALDSHESEVPPDEKPARIPKAEKEAYMTGDVEAAIKRVQEQVREETERKKGRHFNRIQRGGKNTGKRAPIEWELPEMHEGYNPEGYYHDV